MRLLQASRQREQAGAAGMVRSTYIQASYILMAAPTELYHSSTWSVTDTDRDVKTDLRAPGLSRWGPTLPPTERLGSHHDAAQSRAVLS